MARDRRQRRKGFDPLASLFESRIAETGPQRVERLPFDNESTLTSIAPAIDVTDPVFRPPEAASKTAPALPEEDTTLAKARPVKAVAAPAVEAEQLAPAQIVDMPEAVLVSRAVRPRSANEVLAEIRARTAHEADLSQSAIEPEVPEVEIEKAVRSALTVLSEFSVSRLRLEPEHQRLLRAFRGHRDRFTAAGHLDLALHTDQLVESMESNVSVRLASALVRTEAAEWWVWVDLDGAVLLAFFAQPRRFFSLD